MKKHYLLIGAALIAVAAKDSGALPVGQPMTASDKSTGLKAHPQILEEFGGLYEGPQAGYVRSVGQKIAFQSGLANAPTDFTVSLLNTPVNNAFAIPGGYVYVTRQLMGLMNNEAELASVLGHEVGHVAARHSQKRNSRATKAGLGALGAQILGGILGGSTGAQLGQQIGGQLATRWVLGYSRAQEYQADDLGVSYLAKAGYDPIASSTMLASLAAQTELDTRVQGGEAKSIPAWASTHPDPASRVVRAAQNAANSAPTGKAINRDAFLNALDGVMYDDDPKQGVVDGRTFRHPDLKLMFTAPAGYTVSNSPQAVTISGSGGKGQFAGGPYSGDLKAYVAAVFKALGDQNQTSLSPGTIERIQINGLDAARGTAEVAGQSGTTIVTVYAYEFANNQAFHFMTLTSAANAGALNSLYQSIRRLTAQEAAAVRARKVSVVTVRSGDTIEKIAARMAYDDFKVERFTVLNAIKAGTELKPGQKVKIIVYSS
jgi:predicted Zn-dependent protease